MFFFVSTQQLYFEYNIYLENVPLISNSDQYLTGVSKHLCGAATGIWNISKHNIW